MNANKSGQRFETIVSQLLEQNGFDVQMHSGYEGDKTELHKVDYRLALRQPPYTTLYGSPGRSDFVLLVPELDDAVWIETKRMSVSGSLDEKLPHVYLNALAAIPGRHVIILLDGDGWRDGAIEWIKAASHDRRWKDFANYPDKRIDVVDVAEFKGWLEDMRQ